MKNGPDSHNHEKETGGYCPNLKRMNDVSLRGREVSEAIPPSFTAPRTERLPRSRWSLAMTAPHKFPSLPSCESKLGHYPEPGSVKTSV